MQNSARCVLPVTSVSRLRNSAVDQPRRAVARAGLRHLAERDLELVDAVLARLVDARRLARGSDEQPREEVRERRMVQPVADQAAQQVGPAQERAVGGRRPAEHDVVAAAGARVAPVEHELLGGEAQRARVRVELRRLVDELAPARRGVHVHLEHARVGRDADLLDPRIERRRIALDHDGHRERARGVLDRGDELEIVVGARERRHEHVQAAVALLDAERRAHHPVGRLAARGRAVGVAAARCSDALARLRADRRCAAAGVAAALVGVRRQRAALRERIDRPDRARALGALPGQARERQPQPDRRVARDQHDVPRAQHPQAALPRRAARARHAARAAARRRPASRGRARARGAGARAPRARRAAGRSDRGSRAARPRRAELSHGSS